MKKIIPNMCSVLNSICGLFAILLTFTLKTPTSVIVSCVLIFIGVFLDVIDGKLARKFNVVTQMGKELDSFADLITFGLAPSCVLLGLISIYTNMVFYIELLIVVFYVVCTLYRLARYNSNDNTDTFLGLPSTLSGVILSLYIIISVTILNTYINTMVYIVVSMSILVFLGIMMVLKFKVKRII